MARVSHKKIKQLIAQKQSKITDRQFFTSRILANHFADIAAAQTRRYGYRRRIKVQIIWKPKDPRQASTDNNIILINAGNPEVTQHKGRQARYEQVCGLFAHELGHVLYTDFLTSQSYNSFLDAGIWFPEAPPLRNTTERMAEEDLWDYQKADPRNRAMLARIAHNILNVLEDGYIENRMLMDYPGILGNCLKTVQESDFKVAPTIEDLIDNEEEGGHIWLSIQSAILYYMLWGELKYGGTPLSDVRVQMVFSLLSDLDRALVSRDFKDRCRAANLILIRCWSYIKDFIEACKERAEQEADSGIGSGNAEDLLQQLISSIAGGSETAMGSTAPVDGGGSASPGSGGSTATSAQRATTAALAARSGNDEEKDGEQEEESSETGADGSEEPESDEDGGTVNSAGGSGDEGQSDDGDLPVQFGSGAAPSHQEVSDQEGGRIPLQDTSEVSVPEGGGLERDDAYEGTGYTGAAADIERLLARIAEDNVTTELERHRTKELTELAQSISYGDIHAGVKMTVHRIASVSDEMKEDYHSISGELLHISKQLQKSVLQQMQDSRRGGKQTSLLMGRRLDSHALFRTDSRVFYKTALPNEMPALCVGLLLDESGSMSGNDRATYARATAIILYDFCQALNIPITVYGHTTSGYGGVELYSYAEFDAIDRDDRYRMMDISARGSNRDGAALRYVAERLVHRPEDIKLLMLISDGQPADYDYYGTAAEEDLRGIKHEYQRKGILFVAAAIGSDKENIERIYGDSFLDITDLTKLPVKLAGIIKRYIRF